MLELHELTKRFGATTAVDGVSLRVPAGEMLGVIGSSGAGKSTLLRMVNRLAEPTSGRVTWDELDVTALRGRSLRQWRARCAMVFQQFNLAPRLTVLENVLMGCLGRKALVPSLLMLFSREERREAMEALERVGMGAQALQVAGSLSGGQQQRVAIARALMQRPSIILADEPIAALDPRNAERVMEILRQLNREDGLTVLVNLHHIETARATCDRIVGVAAGRVVFDGLPADLGEEELRRVYGPKARPPLRNRESSPVAASALVASTHPSQVTP